jgi:hypothetical protein
MAWADWFGITEEAAVWFCLQSLIIFAVMASNIRWHWTPNGYLAGLIGFVAAYGATVFLSYLTSLLKTKRPSALPESPDGTRYE